MVLVLVDRHRREIAELEEKNFSERDIIVASTKFCKQKETSAAACKRRAT